MESFLSALLQFLSRFKLKHIYIEANGLADSFENVGSLSHFEYLWESSIPAPAIRH